MNPIEIYNKIRGLAAEHGMSLRQLAQKCGRTVNYFYVFKHEEKGYANIMFWIRVAKELGTTVEELMGVDYGEDGKSQR